ncbi:DNA recombination protein RmuC [Demequina salsinemoris]|uniref:DNA recombination protein RmuC n=1 Tax=Demequina salsinemoris TaxID=577470 RepID=UPI000780A1F2|nr:DNA recombination protein RmuC [Demequina salsinemoris]
MTDALLIGLGVMLGALIGFLAARSQAAASLGHARAGLEAANRRLEDQRVAHESYVAQVRTDHETLQREFQALSAQSLRESQETLLRVAQERLARDRTVADAELAKREHAIRGLVEPMAKALDEVKRQTSEADRARAESQAQLTQQVRHMLDASAQLGRQTESLRSALRRPEVRGRWGELHLRRVVEVAGLVNGVDFTEQESGTTGEGNRLRPDMIVTLAGGRRIVVDAKTPLDALLDIDADPDNAEEHAARHVRNVRQRVKELSSKAYREQFGSDIDFSVLFLPAESFLQVATEQDPQLLTDAYESGVVIATPTVLVAILRTVAHTWKAEALAKNAQEVLDTGQELYKRLATMGDHLARVGKAIDQAGEAYNKTIGSMERQVLPQARRFASLQQIDREIETREVETSVRAINAPELLEPTFEDEQAR